MRRIVARVLLFLLIGAVINVAVAWGCTRFAPTGDYQTTARRTVPPALLEGVTFTPAPWGGDLFYYAGSWPALGCRYTLIVAVDRPYESGSHTFNQCGVGLRVEPGWPLPTALVVVDHADLHGPRVQHALWGKNRVLLDKSCRVTVVRALWRGMVFNSLAYAGILGLSFFAASALRRRFRRRRQRCPKCGYDLAGIAPGVCPECGASKVPQMPATLAQAAALSHHAPDPPKPDSRHPLFERFTDRSRKVMALANQEAQYLNHGYLGTEHILLGLTKMGSGIGATVLNNAGLDLKTVRVLVAEHVTPGPEMVTMGKLPQTPRAKKVIQYAIEQARGMNHDYIGSEHILLGLICEEDGVAARVLKARGLDLPIARERVQRLLEEIRQSGADRSQHGGTGEPGPQGA